LGIDRSWGGGRRWCWWVDSSGWADGGGGSDGAGHFANWAVGNSRAARQDGVDLGGENGRCD